MLTSLRFAALVLFVSMVATGQAKGKCGLTPSDTTFLPDNASAQAYGGHSVTNVGLSSDQSGPPFAQYGTFSINRVVGPGTAGEFDPNTGFLLPQSWQTYVNSGVLSRTAFLDLRGPLYASDAVLPLPLTIWLNDKNVATIQGGDPYFYQGCFEIPTNYIKFAQRLRASRQRRF